MNTKNNHRYQLTEAKIKEIFFNLFMQKDLDRISVSEICKQANVNRTTFYLHFTDIYELMEDIETEMSDGVLRMFTAKETTSLGDGFVKLFHFIKEHKDFYGRYLETSHRPSIINKLTPASVEESAHDFASQLGYKSIHEMQYHQEFFSAGLTALIKHWLKTGCQETAEELGEIIRKEYSPNLEMFGHY